MEQINDRSISSLPAILLVIVLSAAGVVADICLKEASQRGEPLRSPYFLAGAVIYGLTAFAWVFAMRSLKLGSLGAIYSVSTVVMLTVCGVVVFHETLRPREWCGLFMAVFALVLLAPRGE